MRRNRYQVFSRPLNKCPYDTKGRVNDLYQYQRLVLHTFRCKRFFTSQRLISKISILLVKKFTYIFVYIFITTYSFSKTDEIEVHRTISVSVCFNMQNDITWGRTMEPSGELQSQVEGRETALAVATLLYMCAVSYTHLDVYKRQE